MAQAFPGSQQGAQYRAEPQDALPGSSWAPGVEHEPPPGQRGSAGSQLHAPPPLLALDDPAGGIVIPSSVRHAVQAAPQPVAETRHVLHARGGLPAQAVRQLPGAPPHTDAHVVSQAHERNVVRAICEGRHTSPCSSPPRAALHTSHDVSRLALSSIVDETAEPPSPPPPWAVGAHPSASTGTAATMQEYRFIQRPPGG